jgi:hypothetical protein
MGARPTRFGSPLGRRTYVGKRRAAGSRNLRTVRALAHVVLVGYHGPAMHASI